MKWVGALIACAGGALLSTNPIAGAMLAVAGFLFFNENNPKDEHVE